MKKKESQDKKKHLTNHKIAAYYTTTYPRRKLGRILRHNGMAAAQAWAHMHHADAELTYVLRQRKPRIGEQFV